MVAPAQLYQAIQPMMKTADPQDIRQALINFLELLPDFARGHNDLGVLCYQAGEKEKARRHYEKAANLEPGNIIFQKNLADFLYVELNLVEEALRIYVQVLELKPDDVETLLVTGHICVASHKFEDAISFYRRVLEIDPSHTTAREYLDKLETRGRLTTEQSDPEAFYAEASHLANSNNPSAAIDKFKEMVARFPDHALAHNDLGVLLYQSGQKDSAGEHYEKARRLQPENMTFAKNLADFYFVEQGRIEDALQIYVDILAKEPADIETLLMTGRICASIDKCDDARVFYERALEIEPWNNDAAELLGKLNSASSAEPVCQLEADTGSHSRAQELASNGQTEEAIEVLENIVAGQPGNALAHNDLGVLYVQGGQSEKALQHYERASQLAPGNTIFKKNLADYYWVKMGRLEDALKSYVAILEVAPENVETLLSLGNVCNAMQQFEDARVFFERVLEIEPWNADAGDKLTELDNLNKLSQTG